ncbi:hypothetical protein L202_03690 [Cryptococcus amylolentus CBS 6039]|uniref:ubiquitinyl hydrolase 1 n=1 Tax=Cryptococcus amylolentus CBS 6039 TaxID=1295533 RepID=A0A1E3HTZ8_9TREE|nr:hypothetical protein L202_03690 [Cryptococcus amylolentus CBS 6039]ODN79782.1 hypothetical protein L202_03690 [Cryptococcus amylolentus CBS 6039]
MGKRRPIPRSRKSKNNSNNRTKDSATESPRSEPSKAHTSALEESLPTPEAGKFENQPEPESTPVLEPVVPDIEDTGIETDDESSASSIDSWSAHPVSKALPTNNRFRPLSNTANTPFHLNGIYLACLSLFGQLYLIALDMVLGLSTWWGGVQKNEHELAEQAKPEVKRKRRRAEPSAVVPSGSKEHFPGMVNLSGTLCYMNSVLQSTASLSSIISHLERVIDLAVEADMPTHVADALLEVVRDLNTPHKSHPPALRPHGLLQALYPLPAVRRLLGTGEQQDAHELFLVLAEAISDEVVKVAIEIAKLRGLGDLLPLQAYAAGKGGGASVLRVDVEGAKKRNKIRGVGQPWEGLLARRRVCQRCGWSETVRLETLSGMELPVPLHGDTTLEACISQYLAPEQLTDVTCEMCSLEVTLQHYVMEVERLSIPASEASQKPRSKAKLDSKGDEPVKSGSFSALENSPTPTGGEAQEMTASRRKRARDARRAETRLREMLESKTVSNFGEPSLVPLPSSGSTAPIPVKWLTARTSSTRQAVVTRPPQTLRLHFIRSEFTMYGTVQKKIARVAFPMVLDLTRFVANGVWEDMSGVKNMLAAMGGQNDPSAPVERRVLYRLESAILHYGFTHSSGHFVCIRRKPSTPSATAEDHSLRPSVASRSCPEGCTCEDCILLGPVRDPQPSGPGKGWLMISDADVEEVGEETLNAARGSVVMLFYERIAEYSGQKTSVKERKTEEVGEKTRIDQMEPEEETRMAI